MYYGLGAFLEFKEPSREMYTKVDCLLYDSERLSQFYQLDKCYTVHCSLHAIVIWTANRRVATHRSDTSWC